jgi:hypothetical protein
MQHRQLQGMNGIPGEIRLGELKAIGNVKTH